MLIEPVTIVETVKRQLYNYNYIFPMVRTICATFLAVLSNILLGKGLHVAILE
jgi:hypothetical protein